MTQTASARRRKIFLNGAVQGLYIEVSCRWILSDSPGLKTETDRHVSEPELTQRTPKLLAMQPTV
jgi:hypothetical protein